jgi:hypothetical protein
MKTTQSISQGMFLMLGLLGMCLPASGTTLTYVGVQTIPTGTLVGGVEIGGLSGISYNPYTDRFVAITDDSRSDGASRLWTLDLAYTGTAFSSVTAVSSVGLKKPDGSTLPLSDTEGIAGKLDGSFYVSHEGLAAGSDPAYSIPPWISRFNGATGNKEADVALPVKFLPRDGSGNPVAPSASNQSSGVVSNLSLECLGITPAKKNLFTANEAALKQDYNGTYNSDTNQAQNSLSRIVRFTGAPGNPVAAEEKVYQADQGTLYIIVRRFNTVPEILPVDDSGRMLVMERGLTQNNTNLGSYRIRIYEVNFNQAGTTNVAGVNSLQGASYTKLTKTLRWESSSNMDNVESMCFGRDVNGFRTLVLASDNNFNGAQTTQFHVLTTDIPAVTRRTLATAVTGSGSVAAAPSVAWYPDGSELALTATPGADFTFGNWTGSVTGSSNPIGLTMDADKSVTANFLSPYQNWKVGYFTAEEISGTELSAPTSDPDRDGLLNLMEYALSLHPRQASLTGQPFLGENGGNLTLTYQKDTAKPDISYQLEASGDLTAWLPVSDELISTNGTVETRRAGVPINGARKFLRLKIIKLF